jgi:hypothetical protein
MTNRVRRYFMVFDLRTAAEQDAAMQSGADVQARAGSIRDTE